MSNEAFATGQPSGMISKGRLEAFSDGVIAVAITILVLDLRVPPPSGEGSLAARLGALWPNYLAYVISFVAIGIMWINHHAMLRRLAAVDHSVLVLNLLLLLCIVVLPFTTSLLSTYLAEPHGGHLAGVVYAGSFLVTSAVFFAMQCHVILRRGHLLHEPVPTGSQRMVLARGAIAVPTYVVAALLALVTPYLTLTTCVALGVFYLVPARRSPKQNAAR